jgi:Leucine-rich repeat (LRR) protein
LDSSKCACAATCSEIIVGATFQRVSPSGLTKFLTAEVFNFPLTTLPAMSSQAPNPDKLVFKTVRVSVIGEQGCGKSTFVDQFITGQCKLSKSAITFETERTMISRIIKRETSAATMHGLSASSQNRSDIVTRYDIHVHDSCALPVTRFLGLENASTADFVIICFNMKGSDISVLFQIFLDLFKVCHAASRPRPPFMLVGLNKNWGKVATDVDSNAKDSQSHPAKTSENLFAVVSKIVDMFQCKLNFVELNQERENDESSVTSVTMNQSSGNQSGNLMPHRCITAVDVFSRAMDEYEVSSQRFLPRVSVCDSNLYRVYLNAQHGCLGCTFKNGWTKDTNVEVFIFPDFVEISLISCNLTDLPQKLFDVSQLRSLDLNDNPLMKLNESFSSLPVLSVLNASNTKLSFEPSILLACTALTELNISRNMMPIASCLLNCVSLTRLDISENVCPLTIDSSVAGVNLSTLAYLNLSKTMCSSFDFIGHLVALKELNLRETGIREDHLFFLSQLKHLRHIDVSHNRLSDISIPVYIETVLVESNQLKSFDFSFFNSGHHKLSRLSLRNNQLTELPKQIWHISSLRDLCFAENNVSMLDFSFAFCSRRLVKCDSEGNPFNLMPPLVSDLLGNSNFSEACEMSIKPMPTAKISVLSKPNCPNFEAISKQLSRIKMIVNIQEKAPNSTKIQWVKTQLLATMNPPRLFFLGPENDGDSSWLEAITKDKPYWDICNPAFKFIHESGGPRQFLGKVSILAKSVPGTAVAKFDSVTPSKTIDFFSASNRHQWELYFKSIIRFKTTNDRQNIFFKSMPGFVSPMMSVNSKNDSDLSSPTITPMSANTMHARLDSTSLSLEPDIPKSMAIQDSAQTYSIHATVSHVSTVPVVSASASIPSEASGKSVPALEQQCVCQYTSVYLSAPILDMNHFLPFFANSDVIVVNLAENSMTFSELSFIVSGIKLISSQLPKHVFVVVDPDQSASIMNHLGESIHSRINFVYVQQMDALVDQILEALKLVSKQKVIEPFTEYFQSFIVGVMKSRPPWTESESMMISFSELLDCIRNRRNSFDPLGKCCLSFLEDAAYDMHQYLLQTCDILDRSGVMVCWNSHISDPVIICNLDMFCQDVIIPLLYSARSRKQVSTESRQQTPSASCHPMIYTPPERAKIWSNLPSLTSKLVTDLDWALVSLQIAAVTFEHSVPTTTDGPSLVPQPPSESVSDRSQPMSTVHRKEGWIYHEDAASRNVKKQWFVCSCGSDGIYSLTWRNSESASVSSGTQSISFAKCTKTTISQTKKNRAGWSHCCRIDHEHPVASAKKVLTTKIVMCFNNEREMREWWMLIETIIAQRGAPIATTVSDLDLIAKKIDLVDPESSYNLMLFVEDDAVSNESRSLTSIFNSIDLGDDSARETTATSVTIERPEIPVQHAALNWLGFSASIDEVSEYILRSVTCSMSMYVLKSVKFRHYGNVRVMFKRRAAMASADVVTASQYCSVAVMAINESSSGTEITVLSAGHECHVLADMLLEAIICSTRTGLARCTVSPIDGTNAIAETYGLSASYFGQYTPSVSSSLSFLSLIHQPKLHVLRRIVHIHDSALTESSRIIHEWAASNNWQYSTFTCLRSECVQATRVAAAADRLVLIVEAPFTVFRGRLVQIA